MHESTPFLEAAETENSSQDTSSRRTFLNRVAATGLGLAALHVISPKFGVAQAATKPKQPEAESGHDYPMPVSHAKTEAQFRKGVLGIANLSLMASQLAVDKATDAATLRFANFELREAIAVSTVLKNLKNPSPPLDATGKAILAKLKAAPKGAAFDKAYIKAQVGSHEFLRDHTETYLTNSKNATSMAEMNTRNLATLALSTFKEHVVETKDILKMR